MRRFLVVSVLAAAAATIWWARSEDPPVAEPIAAIDAPPPAPVSSEPVADPRPAPAPVVLPAAEHVPDAGDARVDVTFELFDEKGHMAGEGIFLQSPPCPSDGGRRTVRFVQRATTNVMGFAHALLEPGGWEVESMTVDRQRFEVTAELTNVVLHKKTWVEKTIRARVIDDQDQPVADAIVAMEGSGAPQDPHRPRLSSGTGRTGADGTISFSTSEDGALLTAVKGPLTAGPVRATADGPEAKLRLFTPAFVRFEAPCAPVFIQYEHGGSTYEVNDLASPWVVVAAGHQRFRARCIGWKGLSAAALEVDLLPKSRTRQRLSFDAVAGLRVRALDSDAVPVVGIQLSAIDGRARVAAVDGGGWGWVATGTTDRGGEVVLTPSVLTAYEPLYELTAGSGWRTPRAVLARLGDSPVALTVVPAGR